ncbi:class I SAM-dependent methyltransferase [Nocardia sp. CNY236]|uniref:class I SAM-dependent methyltransferase n=1 Tax=Nocardia sp. CNY236 TaxID=1169152 RepID=UPI00048C5CAF|nr:class I SAM-dependent methyltransferase [Nocardia sp. CNY236]
MTDHHEHHSTAAASHGHYLPAAGHNLLLPGYDLFTRLLGIRRVHDRLIDQAGLADGQRVLEIGCGPGDLSIRAQRRHPGVQVTGSDPDPLALAKAKRKALGMNGIRFEQGFVQSLPYPDGTFDRVLSSLMLHHVDNDAKAAAASEILRVLRPGGRLHLVDVGGAMHTTDGWATRMVLRNPHLVENVGEAIPDLFRAAGFDCTEVAGQRHWLAGRLSYIRAIRPA